jgi:hypothetical protein
MELAFDSDSEYEKRSNSEKDEEINEVDSVEGVDEFEELLNKETWLENSKKYIFQVIDRLNQIVVGTESLK